MAGNDLESILCIHLTERVGTVTYQRLLDHFGSPEDILNARRSDLANVPNLTAKIAENIAGARNTADVEGELRAAERLGVKVLTYLDDAYPMGLKALRDRPLVLYVMGDLQSSDALSVGMVGARRASQYGVTQAERFAAGLASVGVTVVSGLARGIDAAAHRGALKAGGRSLAVVGNGLGKIYPNEHRELAQTITEHGAVLSELPIATPPTRGNFPPRNRIISALSLGVVVVEAARRSGAIITAKWANEQGKQVFAVPGPVDSPTSRGPHQLIRDGAKLVESCQDVLEELGPFGLGMSEEEATEDARTLAMTQQEKRIFNVLSTRPKTIDEIMAEVGLPANIVNSTLMIMEIKRWVRQLAGKRFVKA